MFKPLQFSLVWCYGYNSQSNLPLQVLNQYYVYRMKIFISNILQVTNDRTTNRTLEVKSLKNPGRREIYPHFLLQWAAKPQSDFKISKKRKQQQSKKQLLEQTDVILRVIGKRFWGQENKLEDDNDDYGEHLIKCFIFFPHSKKSV